MLHSICQQIWKTQQWSQDWKRSVFFPVAKEENDKDCWDYHTIAFISHAGKVMLKILQVRFQQYVNWELPDVQAGFRERQRNQRSNCQHPLDHRKNIGKNVYFCFIDYSQTFDCVDHNKSWKILQEMGTPNHLTCLLQNLYAGQEAPVRTEHGTIDWFQIRKGVRQG